MKTELAQKTRLKKTNNRSLEKTAHATDTSNSAAK
jgi:hypothetical protein